MVYFDSDSQTDADAQALDYISNHPFDGITLKELELVEPKEFYNESETN